MPDDSRAPVRTPPAIVKPIPAELMEDPGTGLDYGIRPDRMIGDITPVDRFFVRNHASTPRVDAVTWALRIEGDGVRRPVTYTYDELWRCFPLVSVVRTIECAGNRRRLFAEELGRPFTGVYWGRGAIGTAEWTGVRLRDLLDTAGITPAACDVMPEGLDAARGRRPLPLAKALADDTLLALGMNGEILPPDHGFPARVVVSGWLGAASVKWVGRIVVSERPLRAPWTTEDYVLITAAGTAPITGTPVASLVELPWAARLPAGPRIVRGTAYAGEDRVRSVDHRVDGGPWRPAVLDTPGGPGLWARWHFRWSPEPGDHTIEVRATDDRGRAQPAATPWNALGYCHNSVLVHPVTVF
ncbi:sulfite oxidase [Microbispora sp. RL4-1S]|uniref:Sulfite oxidase n=1 Tax=Microbispora oryzae TaxID=2806554 RepID=A0A940WSZ4_9ACTN|nr:sulfite oxidase [Microbispora oryzae]MBP2706506.1 sulfite oxidase [Microbispora oryzae]